MGGYTLIQWSKDIYSGFVGMNEIMVLSMLVGGLGELMRYHGGISWLLERVNGLARKLSAESPVKAGECCISLLVLLANLCTANNTVAIILTGKVAHEIAVSNGVDRRRSASLLVIFSCVVHGLIPVSYTHLDVYKRQVPILPPLVLSRIGRAISFPDRPSVPEPSWARCSRPA